jgi:hypothetical protein
VVRFSEPDPSHTLEERVAHWYFSQLDSNSSDDINKREMKPFKRYVKKKAKPKKCARRFTDYCDLNKDKVISLPELKGCLGVSKEGEFYPLYACQTQGQGPRDALSSEILDPHVFTSHLLGVGCDSGPSCLLQPWG